MSGRDKFFAAFNHGTGHAYLEEESRASAAFREAMEIYRGLPEDERPWRILWYEAGPYLAGVEDGIPENSALSTASEAHEVGYVLLGDERCQLIQSELDRGGGGDVIRVWQLPEDGSDTDLLNLVLCTRQ